MPDTTQTNKPTGTWIPTDAGKQANHKTTRTIAELFEQDDQPQADIHDVLDSLEGKLEDLHRNGSELHANCPSCGHTRNPKAKNKSDRFFSTKRTNYQFWTCRQCGHKTTTATLLSVAPGRAIVQRPIVKGWDQQDHSDQVIDWQRAAYASLADFAHRHLERAMPYLFGRGVTEETARAQGLGYLDKNLYIEWWSGLTPELRAGVQLGGLPDCDGDGVPTGRGWGMVKGYQGKVVYPYYDGDGQVIDIRTRSISPNDKMRYMGPRGGYEDRQAQLPYMPVNEDSGTVILTEGEFKSLVPLSAGCLYPVYGLRGTSEPIAPMVQYFQNKTVILAFDNDENNAGAMATIRQGRALRAKGIGVLVLNPAQLGDHSGIDDFINAEGIDILNNLLTPANLLTLAEYEATLDPETTEKLPNPKADIGTVRRWTPAAHVDTFAHPQIADAVSPDEATDALKGEIKNHIQNWQRGQGQLLSSLPAGTGKTTAAMEAAREVIETEHGTISVFLPNHEQIDEKIEDGTLEDFRHIYGRKWDKDENGVRNCTQADTASALTQLGHDVSATLCPSCEMLNWCRSEGYKSQFNGKANRAYVHNHIFTNYPEGSDIAIIDEATHKTFIQSTSIYGGHIQRALAEGLDNQAERELLESLMMMFTVPNIETLNGIEFYSVLQRFYPELIEAAGQWGDGLDVQGALFDMVLNCTQTESRNVYEVEQLPPAFAQALFSVLNEDVRRLAQGQQPTGRIKLVNAGSHRYIEIVSSKQLPGWYYKTPTILLNATANETVMRELFGVEDQLRIYSPEVAVMAGNEIIQDVTINNAKSGLLGSGEVAERQRAAWIDRIRDHISNHDQSDVVLITVKPLVSYLTAAFPNARVAWYGALEGRNDLQAGLTILCNPPAINLPAIQDEARSLWPGIDTTLTRKSASYDDIQNDEGQYLAIEQIDAVDPRLSALIDQHRDALTIQAIGRARLVRNSGRRVVVMFSRPIPGYAPTETIYSREQRNEYKANKTLEKLIAAAGQLLEAHNNFSYSSLAAAAGSARKTVHKYWQDVIDGLGINWVELPFLQPLANGGWQSVTVRIAANDFGIEAIREIIQNARDVRLIHSLYNTIIGNGSTVHLSIPESFVLDIKAIYPDTEIEEAQPTTTANLIEEEAVPAQVVEPAQVAPIIQVARTTFDMPELAQAFAMMIDSGGLYNVTVDHCTVDRSHRYGFDISHLETELTQILQQEVTKKMNDEQRLEAAAAGVGVRTVYNWLENDKQSQAGLDGEKIICK